LTIFFLFQFTFPLLLLFQIRSLFLQNALILYADFSIISYFLNSILVKLLTFCHLYHILLFILIFYISQ